ncbi:alpha/beta hydrolase [Stenotrophomonas sp.]|uniref:alpha/beta hydrolase family protein n=1 Tax=Stenotrophomonas sp. TaxID=69392 RepID=UPI0028A22691|nr:alpha/beta hydrolase [Stenotrophomonas sp.]
MTKWNVQNCLLLYLSMLLPVATATAAPETPPDPARTIKRFMFSADNFQAVDAEFQEMGVTFAHAPKAPGEGSTMRVVGLGRSGFSTSYAIDHVRGNFHVYAERHRPQQPIAPLPYIAQEVVFDSSEPGISPVGTLSYPATAGPFPAVVLVAGSGPHTRDGGMSLHKTLEVLADHLTRKGFAVLRYDKRGVGLTGGALHPGSTTDEYAMDALAAVRYLKLQPNIQPEHIGIVGHSEGGIIAAMAAAQAPEDVAFIVMLAGTGLPGIEIKSLQDAAARRAEGMPEALVRMNQMQERELFEIAASDASRQDAIAAMAAATERLSSDVKATLEIPAEGIPVEAYEELLTPWFRRFLTLDPRTYLQKVTCPVLALLGEKDLQVPPAENGLEIARTLKRSGNEHVSVRALSGINHNLQTAKTGKASEYFLIEETISPSVLETTSSWLQDVVLRGGEAATPPNPSYSPTISQFHTPSTSPDFN